MYEYVGSMNMWMYVCMLVHIIFHRHIIMLKPSLYKFAIGLIFQLTPRSRALLEKPPVAQPLKNFPTFYGARRFITVFTTRARHRSLSWDRLIQSITPHPISLRSILILSSRLRLPSGIFHIGFPSKTLYAFLHPHTCYIPCSEALCNIS
jgi:hypothetical protein